MARILEEVLRLRTAHAKHFATDEPGHFVAKIQHNQHFRHKNGHWEDVENLLSEDGQGGVSANALELPAVFGKDGSYGWNFEGQEYRFRPKALWLYDIVSGTKVKIADAQPKGWTAAELRKVEQKEVFPGVDFRAELMEGSLAKIFLFKRRPEMPNLIARGLHPESTRLVVELDAALPTPILQNGTPISGVVKGECYIGSGEKRLTLPQNTAWDSRRQEHRTDVELISNADFAFALALDYRFAMQAKYPLFLDPTATFRDTFDSSDDWGLAYQSTMAVPTDGSNTAGPAVSTPTTNPTVQVGCATGSDGKSNWNESWRYLLRFSLASLAGYNLMAATLAVTQYSRLSTGITNGFYIDVLPDSKDWGTSPTTVTGAPAFQAAASWYTMVPCSGPSAAITTFSTDVAGGVTGKLGNRVLFRLRGTPAMEAGGGGNYLNIYNQDTTSNTYRPTLTIDYSTGAAMSFTGAGGATASGKALVSATIADPVMEAMGLSSADFFPTYIGTPWVVGSAAVAQDGVSCAKSGTIGDSGDSRIVLTAKRTVTISSFWSKVSSEDGYDFLTIYKVVGGMPANLVYVSGNGTWVQWVGPLNLNAGDQIVLRYNKDTSGVGGDDAAYVDSFVIAGGAFSASYQAVGGAAASGTALRSQTANFSFQASGGAAATGAALTVQTSNYSFQGVGGAAASGTAAMTAALAFQPSGGASGTGASPFSAGYNLPASGGAAASGTAAFTQTSVYSFQAQGGATVAGTAANSQTSNYSCQGAGGAVSSGAAAANQSVVYTYQALGGASASGAAIKGLGFQAKGGASASGVGAVSQTSVFTYVASGGAAGTGAALRTVGLNFQASGTATGTGASPAGYLPNYVFQAAGGGVANTITPVFPTYNFQASGGVSASGVAASSNVAVYAYQAVGGAAASGTAAKSQTAIYSFQSVGGATASGSAPKGLGFQARGGASASGASVSTATASFSYQASGGAAATGIAASGLVLGYQAQGGGAASGVAPVIGTAIYSYQAVGGATATGAALRSNTVVYSYQVTGGAVAAGSAPNSQTACYAHQAQGGAVASGAAASNETVEFAFQASGGAVASGGAASGWTARFNHQAAGGAAVSGTAARFQTSVFSHQAQGGAAATATSVLSVGFNFLAAGGAQANGVATTSRTVNLGFVATGGAVASGIAFNNYRTVYGHQAAGGARSDGAADRNYTSRFNYQAQGGARGDGEAGLTVGYDHTSIVHVQTGGEAGVTYDLFFEASGGAEASGEAISIITALRRRVLSGQIRSASEMFAAHVDTIHRQKAQISSDPYHSQRSGPSRPAKVKDFYKER